MVEGRSFYEGSFNLERIFSGSSAKSAVVTGGIRGKRVPSALGMMPVGIHQVQDSPSKTEAKLERTPRSKGLGFCRFLLLNWKVPLSTSILVIFLAMKARVVKVMPSMARESPKALMVRTIHPITTNSL